MVRCLVSFAIAAKQLQLRVPTLREWRLKRKNLEFVKVGRRVCVTQESIDRLVIANTIPPLTMSGIQNHTVQSQPPEKRQRSSPNGN